MGKATVDGKKPKAVKKMKDPNAPKRAMSAFFIWMNENRDRIKKPGMSVGDVAKAAGIEWAAMTDKSDVHVLLIAVTLIKSGTMPTCRLKRILM
ncbi:high mobility group protein [Loa loa]|uniref:High mobility group protein n=1 Tax=Loa loa TaxID=7209 RepID=A0A1S0TW59_LOALO|nr:high mobility group protein [Loa loa]EFO20426.2 high mobility group protein [Loa loa]